MSDEKILNADLAVTSFSRNEAQATSSRNNKISKERDCPFVDDDSDAATDTLNQTSITKLLAKTFKVTKYFLLFLIKYCIYLFEYACMICRLVCILYRPNQ